jgi:hypothetical protein
MGYGICYNAVMSNVEFSVTIEPRNNVVATFGPDIDPIRLVGSPFIQGVISHTENKQFSTTIFELIGCPNCPRFRALAKRIGYVNDTKNTDEVYYSGVLALSLNDEMEFSFPNIYKLKILDHGCVFPCGLLDVYNLPPESRDLEALCINPEHSFNREKYKYLFDK